MYAIIEAGGRQWKVEPGTRLEINRVTGDAGAQHTVERVLLAHDGSALQIGHPYVAGAKVVCEVVAKSQGPKVITYKFRRRENWRKTVGHRQPLTKLIVKEILWNGKGADVSAATAKTSAATTSTAESKTSKKPAIKRVAKTSTQVAKSITRPTKEAT